MARFVYLFHYFSRIVFLLAYRGLIPTEIQLFPFYDSVGHCILYGTWAYLAAKSFPKRIYANGVFTIPFGIVLITVIAIIEESFQTLSPVRTFSLYDVGWGIVGSILAWLLWRAQE